MTPGTRAKTSPVQVEALEPSPPSIDLLLDQASHALSACDYFEAQDLCLRALSRLQRSHDFERLARLCLPLQESRRQIRQQACDANRSLRLSKLPARGAALEPGRYLLEPPLLGIDGRNFRETLRARRVPAMVLVKEPTTSAGKWPIVGVGLGALEPVVVRIQVDPPNPPTDPAQPDSAWFLATQEALGDAAMRKVKPHWPAQHRVEDLLELLDAVPDHEKLAQLLQSTCREAITAPPVTLPRRRPRIEDPYSF